MDWGGVADKVTFGEVSAEDADDAADVFLLIAPQNIVGNTIMTNLSDMVRASPLALPCAGRWPLAALLAPARQLRRGMQPP